MSSDLRWCPASPPAPPLRWAVAVAQRGYSALHPAPEVPRPGVAQQAAAVRDAFAPAAPLLATRAMGGAAVETLAIARASDAASWFRAQGGRAVAVVPPFQPDGVVDDVAAASTRLDPDVGLVLVVPVGHAVAFSRLAADLGRPVRVSAYRSDLLPAPLHLPTEAPRAA